MVTHYIALTYEPKIAAVRQGTVRQTIRRVGKRVYKVGDKVVLHGWAGKPYRSPWNWRTEPEPLIEIPKIYIDEDNRIYMERDGGLNKEQMSETELDILSARDGIVPPTANGLRAALKGRNGKNYQGRYNVLRW